MIFLDENSFSVDVHRPGPIRMEAAERNFLELFINLRKALQESEGTEFFEPLTEQILDLCNLHFNEVQSALALGVRKSLVYALRLAKKSSVNSERAETFLHDLEASIASEAEQLKKCFSASNYSSITIANLLTSYSKRSEFEYAYDGADHLFDAALGYEPPNFSFQRVGENGLWFQPTPISLLVKWFEEKRPAASDIIYDLGSGTGRTAIAMALLSDAQVRAVEIVERHCLIARNLIDTNQIPRCEVVNKDILNVNFSDGTIFYIFNSFEGELLEQVVDKLKTVALIKPITIAAMGDCRTYLNKCEWLKQSTPANESCMTIGRYASLDPIS